MQSLFLKATSSGWYPEFLMPIVDIVTANARDKKILDIGTGPGTLAQMLITRDSTLHITGIDTNKAMIDEARKRMSHINVSFEYEKINAELEFADSQFDVVTFCSVLFLLDDSIKTHLMKEALRVLKPTGEIVILTPTGKKLGLSSLNEVLKYPFPINNFTFLIWKIATINRGRKWQKQKWLEKYAGANQLNYSQAIVFNDNASVETISSITNQY